MTGPGSHLCNGTAMDSLHLHRRLRHAISAAVAAAALLVASADARAGDEVPAATADPAVVAPTAPVVPAAPVKPPAATAPWLTLGLSSVLKNPVNITTGKPGAIGLSYVLNASFKLKPNLFLSVDMSIGTPMAAFNPTPGIGVGPAFKVTKKLILNPSVTYAYTPKYTSAMMTEAVHSAGACLASGIPVGNGIIVALPICVSRNLTAGQTVLVFAFKVGFGFAAW